MSNGGVGGAPGGGGSDDASFGNATIGLGSGQQSPTGRVGVNSVDQGLIGSPSTSPSSGFYGGWENATSNSASQSEHTGFDFSASTGAQVGALAGIPFGPPGTVIGALMGGLSSLAGGDPNFSPGVSGSDGSGAQGGGPVDRTGSAFPTPGNYVGRPGAQPFRINPMQVQNDMRGGWGNQGQGGWGGGYQQPQMNPFSMYGSRQPANLGYNPFSMYGGK